MNPGVFSVKNNRVVFVAMAFVLVGGFVAYRELGRLEDPEFTIKEALIVTPYPGASAEEVALEVTNPIETACQQLGQLERVESESLRGRSVVKAVIRDRYDTHRIPQVWDELRRKIADVQAQLPPSVRGQSAVIDDFGDVYGIFFAITGEGFTYPELRRYAEFLRRELLLVDSVNKVELFGAQQEQVFLEISRQRLARLGINEDQIYSLLQAKNVAADGGRVRVGDEHVPLDPAGGFRVPDEMLDIVIGSDRTGRQLTLRDVADLERGYSDPPRRILRFDGQPAIGIGISTVQGGNVVRMGEGVRRKLEQLKANQPIGIEIGEINFQPEAVSAATSDFMFNLAKAVTIVVVVLLFTMGRKTGIIIGLVLFLTIMATFLVMYLKGDLLMERISLGALIIALCMLTDNAIIMIEGVKVRIEAGEDKLTVVREMVAENQWPLFGATAIGVLAFASIAWSEHSTGEYTNSLFWVILIALSLSWVSSVTITPLLGCLFLSRSPAGGAPTLRRAFQAYRRPGPGSSPPVGGGGGVRRRAVLSLYGFTRVKQSFFPPATRRSSWWMCSCRPAPTSARRRRSRGMSKASSSRNPGSRTSRRLSAAAACGSCSCTPPSRRTGRTCSSWWTWTTRRRSTDCSPLSRSTWTRSTRTPTRLPRSSFSGRAPAGGFRRGSAVPTQLGSGSSATARNRSSKTTARPWACATTGASARR